MLICLDESLNMTLGWVYKHKTPLWRLELGLGSMQLQHKTCKWKRKTQYKIRTLQPSISINVTTPAHVYSYSIKSVLPTRVVLLCHKYINTMCPQCNTHSLTHSCIVTALRAVSNPKLCRTYHKVIQRFHTFDTEEIAKLCDYKIVCSITPVDKLTVENIGHWM